jgi:hypothetical protein
VTGNAPSGSMSPSRVHPPGGCPESHSQGVLEMLAPLIVDLLMTCTLFMLAGWAYDAVGRWFEAGRPFIGSAVPEALGPMMRMDRRKAMPGVRRHATGESWAYDREALPKYRA